MSLKVLKDITKIWPLYLFLLVYLSLGLITFSDYGISNIEPDEYKQGILLKTFMANETSYQEVLDDLKMTDPVKRHENPLFNSKYYGYTALLSVLNKNNAYELNHLINIFFSSLIFIFSYGMIFYKYRDKFLALVGPSFLFFTPRLIGHIPINPRDTPFMVMFFISVTTLYLLNHTKNKVFVSIFFKSFLLGVLFGITQSLGLFGLLLYLVLLAQILHNLIYRLRENKLKTKIKYLNHEVLKLFLIILTASLTMIVTWPYMGSNFLFNFLNKLTSFYTFSGTSESIFYLGGVFSNANLPWHYLPVWLLVTTPSIVLVLFFVSLIFLPKKMQDDLYFINFIVFCLVIAAYFFIRLPVYQGLRQFLFILPFIAMNAAIILVEIIYEARNKILKYALLVAVLISFGNIGYSLWQIHPYEYVYFNESMGGLKNAANFFEVDYLKTSNKEVSDWIIRDVSQNNLDKPEVFSCEKDDAYSYLGKDVYGISNNSSQADYIACPNIVFKIEPTHQITREGVVFNNISKVNNIY